MNMNVEDLERQARQIVKVLEQNGHSAYMVGGYVRDTVLGRPVKDIDIATSAKPETVQSLFERTVPTGLQHGTITVMRGSTAFEVTTFRTESDYIDFRRPAEVVFVDDLAEDLLRRDFTMNAMAMAADGAIHDPFGGREDIASGILRCVGNPRERFREDALRIVRGVRFAAEYGLDVEPETWSALIDLVPLMKHIAMERVRAELERMVTGSDPNRALMLLTQSGVLKHLKQPLALPFISVPSEEAAESIGSLPDLRRLDTPIARWSCIALALAIEEKALKSALRDLTFSKQDTEAILQRHAADRLFREQLDLLSANKSEPAVALAWKQAAIRSVPAASVDLVGLYRADARMGLAEGDEAVLNARELVARHGGEWLEELPAQTLSELALTGKELTEELGASPGPWVGAILQELLRQTAVGETGNNRSELLDSARKLYKKMESR